MSIKLIDGNGAYVSIETSDILKLEPCENGSLGITRVFVRTGTYRIGYISDTNFIDAWIGDGRNGWVTTLSIEEINKLIYDNDYNQSLEKML